MSPAQAAVDFVNIALAKCHGTASEWKALPTITNVATTITNVAPTNANVAPSFFHGPRNSYKAAPTCASGFRQAPTRSETLEGRADKCKRDPGRCELGRN
jgi:hypothetical protein